MKKYTILIIVISVFLFLPLFAEEKAGDPDRLPKHDTFQKAAPFKYDLSKDSVLYTIGYAHLDTQWRWTFVDSIKKFIPNTMHYNFKLFEKYPNYVFNFTGSRRYKMMKEYYPEDYKKVKEYISKGRWHVAGSSVEECDVLAVSPESIIRQVLYGNHFFKNEFNKTSIDFYIPDCFGFPYSLPSVLSHCGLAGFSSSRIPEVKNGTEPFTIARWEGPDGKSIIMITDPGGLGSSILNNLSRGRYWKVSERIATNAARSGIYADYHYYGVGDQGGSPKEKSVLWLEKSIIGKGPIKILPSSTDQIFRDLSTKQVSRLPLYKGELIQTGLNSGSITSQGYIKRWNRKNELLAYAAEVAAVAGTWLGSMVYPNKKLNCAWDLVLGNQMHDILPGTSTPKAYEYSWNDQIIALNMFSAVLENSAGAAAQAMDTRAEGVPVVVFNPLSIEREDIVKVRIHHPKKAPESLCVFNPDNKEVLSQIIEKNDDHIELIFLAQVPSTGFAVYDIRRSASPCNIRSKLKITKSSLENNCYIVRINKNGDVSRIYDKINKKELLSGPVRMPMLDTEGCSAWRVPLKVLTREPVEYVGGPARIRIRESGPLRAVLEIDRRAGSSQFIQRIRLSEGSPGKRVEFAVRINWKGLNRLLKVSFPFKVSNPNATYSMGLGTIERSNHTKNKHEVPAHQWMDLTDKKGDYGVSLLEDCKYASDKPNDNTLRLTLLYTPGDGVKRQDQEYQDLGRHEILYALYGHKGGWEKGKVPWEAARLNQPLRAFRTIPHKGTLGKRFSFIKIDSPDIFLQAVKKAEESDEIIIRVNELFGKPHRNVKLSMAAPIISAREVNGQEATIGKARIRGGKLNIDMPGYGIRSFALKLASPRKQLTLPISRPLDIPYNKDVVSLDKNRADGNIEKGLSIPGRLFSGGLLCENIKFKTGPVSDNKKNVISCEGQEIDLLSGKYNRLYILAASKKDDVKGIFTIDGEKISLNIQKWNGYIGQWDNRIGKDHNRTWLLRSRESYTCYGIQPGFIKPQPIAWLGTHSHHYKEGDMPYEYCYIFKYRIDLPKGARKLILPDNENILVFAITLASDANDDTRAAYYLYEPNRDEKLSFTSPEGVEFPEGFFDNKVKDGKFKDIRIEYKNNTLKIVAQMDRDCKGINAQLYINSDDNEKTGAQRIPPGVDFMVEGGKLYKFSSKRQRYNYGWKWKLSHVTLKKGNKFEISIPAEIIGIKKGQTIRMSFNSYDDKWNILDHMPEKGEIKYIVGKK